jgi:hypothetical protein
VDSSSRERLVDDFLKWIGDLDSIFSLSSVKKMNSMVSVGRRKLGRTTTHRLLE